MSNLYAINVYDTTTGKEKRFLLHFGTNHFWSEALYLCGFSQWLQIKPTDKTVRRQMNYNRYIGKVYAFSFIGRIFSQESIIKPGLMLSLYLLKTSKFFVGLVGATPFLTSIG